MNEPTTNVTYLTKKTGMPPPLFDDDEHKVEELEEVRPIEGRIVDDPNTVPVGWMAERRSVLAERPAIIPAYLRDRRQLSDGARFVAKYYGHHLAFHTVRTPVYASRVWARTPRGTGRLTARWWRWVTYSEVDRHRAEEKTTTADWVRTEAQLRQWRGGRRRASAIVGVPTFVIVCLAYFLLPAWILGSAAAGIAFLLGMAGRQPDRPIISRYVYVHVQRRLESPEVERAIEAIGVKGRIDFVNPIATDGPGWLAEIDLPGDTVADDVIAKRARLAAAMRRPLGCVWPEGDRTAHPGRLRLWIGREDPSKAPRRLWPLLKSGQANLFEPIPFGFDPRGRLVSLLLMSANVLIGGVMGSGKTSAVLAIMLAAALDAIAELHVYELKGSGDLDSVEDVCRVYVSGDDDEHCEAALNGMRWLEKEMKRRKALIKDLPIADVPDGRKVSRPLAMRRELGLHPIVAVFDEAHTLFEHEKYGPPAAKVGADLIRKARAYGIIIIFTTQRPDKDSIPKRISDNAILRFCLAVTSQVSNDMILGTSQYKRGVRATIFDPQTEAGTGYYSRSALHAEIVRAAFITQKEAREVGQRAKALRIAAGTMPQQQGQLDAIDSSTILDHLIEIWPDGEETMHSHRLVEAMAVVRPEVYGPWMATDKPVDDMAEEELREVRSARSTMLAAALKPHGLLTRQINKRGDGGGGKGVRLEDLEKRLKADDDPV